MLRIYSVLPIIILFVIFMAGIVCAAEDDGGGAKRHTPSAKGIDNYNAMISKIIENKTAQTEGIAPGSRLLVPDEYATIQTAIDSSSAGDTVLVSDGTYFENIYFRGKAITVASHFLVDGDTSHISQTVIDGSSSPNADTASVVYFVNGEDTTSVLCGFTVTGGSGTVWLGPEERLWRMGGGIYCVGALGAKIMYNHIIENTVSGSDDGVAGGGVAVFGEGHYIFEHNLIKDNHITINPGSGYGGGISVWGNASVRVMENILEGNSVTCQGFAVAGAMEIAGFSSFMEGQVKNNIFRANMVSASTQGGVAGALSLYSTADMVVENNIFSGNLAKSSSGWGEGGALLLEDTNLNGYGRKIIKGNTFVNNKAQGTSTNGRGGAIEIFNSLATLSNNLFYKNAATGGEALGGAIRDWHSSFHSENDIFVDNEGRTAGAVSIDSNPQRGPRRSMVNNTIVNNSARFGGGINLVNSSLALFNTLIWGNEALQGTQLRGSTYKIAYCNIEHWIYSGEGNISRDPFFADDTLFHLSDSSACIGQGAASIEIDGTTYLAPETDYDGNSRPDPAESAPDIGAQENSLGVPDGLIIIPDQYATIQEGIDASENGDVVLVRDGNYQENINFKGKAITLASYYFLDKDTSHISNTIIDGSNPANPDSGSVVTFNSGEDTTSVLMGFTITGGTGTIHEDSWGTDIYVDRGGSGIFCYYSGATIKNNKIINNHITTNLNINAGGAIAACPNKSDAYIVIAHNQIMNNTSSGNEQAFGSAIKGSCNAFITQNSISNNSATSNDAGWATVAFWSEEIRSVLIKQNRITGNTANCTSWSSGGGIYLEAAYDATITSNHFENNSVSGTQARGGAIRLLALTVPCTIEKNWIVNNNSSRYGGAMSFWGCSKEVFLSNNIIARNTATDGGGLNSRDSKTILINNTIVENTALRGGGLRATGKAPTIVNTIIWGNTNPQINGLANIYYSNIEGESWADPLKGIIVSDPSFADTLSYDLQTISGCIGAGMDSIEIAGQWYHAPMTDYDGDVRPMPGTSSPDIGAQEHADSIATSIDNREINTVASYKLYQNYPNPFNPITTIGYSVRAHGNVPQHIDLSIYNLLGQKVATLVNKKQAAGVYQVQWDASGFATGVYIYTLETSSGFKQSWKLVLLK